jgi:hypothetical protein
MARELFPEVPRKKMRNRREVEVDRVMVAKTICISTGKFETTKVSIELEYKCREGEDRFDGPSAADALTDEVNAYLRNEADKIDAAKRRANSRAGRFGVDPSDANYPFDDR